LLNILTTYFFIILFALTQVWGCNSPKTPKKKTEAVVEDSSEIKVIKKCADCHPFTLDQNHQLGCTTCHGGSLKSNSLRSAHAGVDPEPSHPENMAKICGGCHDHKVKSVMASKHFTLTDEINLVRQSFGANDTILDPRAIPQTDHPTTPLALADDLLRRRCLRCHLFSPGDDYPATKHASGCGACHLVFKDGKLLSHQFNRLPTDENCLSCHHGNFVGGDYYGLFEQDYNWEYRTPFSLDDLNSPPFGVRNHRLRPDIHQTAGLNCIDCHSGSELMGENGETASCEGCHAAGAAPKKMRTKISQKSLIIPQIDLNLHGRKDTACQVCHAQWSFVDSGTHLLRIDTDEYDPWTALTQQGSSEVQQLLEANLFSDGDTSEPAMLDQFSRLSKPGVWLKSFGLRRWEDIPTCFDEKKILQVCRPILDIHLSYLNENGEVVIDAVKARTKKPVMRPYAPHTIGKAGVFILNP